MSRIPPPASVGSAPEAARPPLGAVRNLFRGIANSPAAPAGYPGVNGALAKGSLDARTCERIALAVAPRND